MSGIPVRRILYTLTRLSPLLWLACAQIDVTEDDLGGAAPAIDAGVVALDRGVSGEQLDAGSVEPPEPTCDEIPQAVHAGSGCVTDVQCGEGARCLRLAGASASTCYQRCVPGLCEDLCATAADCTPLLGNDGAQHYEDGVAAGYCATARSCLDVMTCVYGCSNPDCQASCYEGAGQEAMREASELVTCLNREGPGCQDDACLAAACAECWHCMPGDEAEPDAGLRPDAGPRPDVGVNPQPDVGVMDPPPGSVACEDAWLCQLNCGGAAACEQGCLNGAAPGVAEGLAALDACLQRADHWRDVADVCPAEWGRCQMPPVGHSDCATAYQCLMPCEAQDTSCQINCQLSARSEALAQLSSLGDCINRNNVETIEQAMSSCRGEWVACGLEEVRIDGASCRDTVYCVIECGNDGNCQQACLNAASSQSEQDALGVFQCGNSIGAVSYSDIANQCAEWSACGMPNSANQGCSYLFMQVYGGACANNQRCVTDSMINTSRVGVEQFIALSDCMSQAFAGQQQITTDDLRAACPAQYVACGL